MKHIRRLAELSLTIITMAALSVGTFAADYSFETGAGTEYYPATSYADTYGAAYNYGGPNLVDYQIPELPYGVSGTTQIGIMEKNYLPGLQQNVGTSISGEYGISDGLYDIPATAAPPVLSVPAYTGVDGMERKDGSIGTLKIPSLNINMKVWEGETRASMAKGLGHYSSTSGWDGNIGICGHNRGAKYNIGSIRNLEIGDNITYSTVYGTRTYAVILVKTISDSDWSYLQATADNRITITTCLANQPSKRVCVQAEEVSR
jgi:LPXTG-site transpeptidase (sortase) family protein